jgi:negative regulator of sigma E activity
MRRLCLVAILLALACGKQNDADKLEKTIVSWKATLQIVADARLKNEVHDGFALKTIDEAIDDLESQSSKATNKRAEQLIGIAGKLRQAIEADDRAAIVKARGELR